MSAFTLKEKRENLARIIADVFREWPDLERKIFNQAHYQGESPESISRSLNVEPNQVHCILLKCEQELHISLRDYRENLVGSSAE